MKIEKQNNLIMKRTLLLIVALIFGVTSANAQKFVSLDGNDLKRTVQETKNLDETKILKTTPTKSNAKWAALLVDFDVDTEYNLTTLSGHTAGDKAKFARFDSVTNDVAYFANNYPWLHQYFGMAQRGFYFFNALLGEGTGNGFAMVSPLDQYRADGNQNNSVINTAIELTTPLTTVGWNVVDVEFNQYTMRFNADKYFVDWSTSPTFATYDSIEFNVRGVELNSNDDVAGRKRVTLPLSSTLDQTALYIRLRYAEYNSTTQQPSGYVWIVDSITVDNGPEARLDIIAAHHGYSAYHIVPEGYPLDTLLFFVDIKNTGGEDITNVYATERMHLVDDPSAEELTYTFIQENRNNPNWLVEYFIDDTTYVMDPITLEPGESAQVAAVSSPLANETPGFHMLSTGVNYNFDGEDILSQIDTIFYQTQGVDPAHDSYASMRWGADYDMLFEGISASYGYISIGGTTYITDDCPLKFSTGFEVCTRYMTTAQDPNGNPWYAKGIEVVPAVDSCEAGITIQGSLKRINWANEELTMDNLLETVAVSNLHVTNRAELNNDLFTDESTSYERTRDFNTIFLPLNTPNIELDSDSWYYACYKLLDDGMFLVGNDSRDRAYTLNPDDYYSNIVNVPGLSDYAWGNPFGTWLSNNSFPMIRLFISQDGSSIDEVATSAFNVNAYPNPAQDEVSIEYTLATSGNVVITINDITGREVVKMNQGNQTANTSSRVNINTSNLSNGAYFYNVIVNGVKQTNKLIINK